MIGLLQMRPIPSHQTKGLRCREVGGRYDLESLYSVSARSSDRYFG